MLVMAFSSRVQLDFGVPKLPRILVPEVFHHIPNHLLSLTSGVEKRMTIFGDTSTKE